MENSKLERINELAKKARESGLSEDEKQEQLLLREEYIEGFRRGTIQVLEQIIIADENGNQRKLSKKKGK